MRKQRSFLFPNKNKADINQFSTQQFVTISKYRRSETLNNIRILMFMLLMVRSLTATQIMEHVTIKSEIKYQ